MNKFSRSAYVLGTVARIAKNVIGVTGIVMICVLIVLSIANHMDPNTVIGTELNIVDIGPLSIELMEEYTPDNDAILRYAWVYGVLYALIAAAVYVGLGYVQKILAPIAEGNPFHPETAVYLKKFAYVSLILGLINNVSEIIGTTVALRSFNLDKLLASDIIQSISVNYEIDLGFVIVFLVIMLMSYIFSYGAELQKLSDETL